MKLKHSLKKILGVSEIIIAIWIPFFCLNYFEISPFEISLIRVWYGVPLFMTIIICFILVVIHAVKLTDD